MTRSQTVASPVQSQVSPISRSLISRFTAPFSSKQRNPVEQEIRLDEPFRQHFSGDNVKGAVLLDTTRPTRITHLVIRLHGFVKVVNNARLPGETIPYDENLLTSMRSRRGIEYFGNGFARLFEDERVLCGDGRLGGRYEFRFELKLPSKNIPSSIDFEHGTISYLLTSTITRPTTISPTLTYHHKLNVTGTVDIARLQPPKPHIVALEADGKKPKGRVREKRKSGILQNCRDSVRSNLDEASVNRMSSPGPPASDFPPQSPVPSIISSTSRGSSDASASNNNNDTTSRTVNSGETGSLENVGPIMTSENTITAKTELLQGGCLPGDTLPLRISIEHTRPIKTMQGMIITIFRQGRIDTHPALPVSSERDGRRRYEDYYPKSRTGLGGLSLSSAGSSRVFRQDLAQTITPLIVDPRSLTAVIKTSIQMPDHAFPTITSVPGGMISFKYFVEVVMDLRGRLGSQDRFFPHLSITNAPQHSFGDSKVSKIESVDGVSYSASPGFNYLITDQIRRTKGVVFTTTEVIVGTRNSARCRGKQREPSNVLEGSETVESPQHNGELHALDAASPTAYQGPVLSERRDWQHPHESGRSDRQTAIIPPPNVEEPQDEKSQIRRAEERLLPSSPPQDDEPSPAMAPSAPFAYDEEDLVNRYGFGAPAPAYDWPSTSSPRINRPPPTAQSPTTAGPMPTDEDSGANDDKQELEMQRLQALRSAPEDDEEGAGRSTQPHQPIEPSAPVLNEVDPSASPTSPHPPSPPQQLHPQDQHELEHHGLQAPPTSPNDHNPARHPEPSAPTLDEVELPHTNNDHNADDDNNNEGPPMYAR